MASFGQVNLSGSDDYRPQWQKHQALDEAGRER